MLDWSWLRLQKLGQVSGVVQTMVNPATESERTARGQDQRNRQNLPTHLVCGWWVSKMGGWHVWGMGFR